MTRLATLVFLLTVFSAGRASAQTADGEACASRVYEALGRHLRVEHFVPQDSGGYVVSASCRTWPADPRTVLAAVAYDAGIENEKTLVVAMLDARNMRVRSSYMRTVDEDALTVVGDGSIRLDTGRYRLNDSLRAFGVRFVSAAVGASCPDGNWGDELTLFVPEGRTLRPVFRLFMYQQLATQGCLSAWSKDAVWDDAMLTLDIGKTRTNGYADLLVTASITTDANDGENHGEPRVERQLMRYDGQAYQPVTASPTELPPWWMGS